MNELNTNINRYRHSYTQVNGLMGKHRTLSEQGCVGARLSQPVNDKCDE